MPAQRAVGIVLPLFFYSSVLFQKKVHFVAIGGWIGDLLNRNPIYKKYVKSFRGIYVQTNSLKHKLEEMGLSNTIYFPNFRIYNDNDIINKIEISKIDKIVLYSRITKEKGVELAIDTIDEINKRRNLTIRLSIYGPIEPSYKERFKRIIHNKENILYKGIIQPDKVKQTLSSYDLLLFPTYYEGEGFPGTILDAMSAGVPIIASDWKYNSEIIVNEYTGLLFEVKNRSDLMNKLNFAIKNPSLINQMRINCIDESKKFCADNVGLILINSIQKAEKLNR
jgi:glycosyltransferase involved in cell wall biosynthesis